MLRLIPETRVFHIIFIQKLQTANIQLSDKMVIIESSSVITYIQVLWGLINIILHV